MNEQKPLWKEEGIRDLNKRESEKWLDKVFLITGIKMDTTIFEKLANGKALEGPVHTSYKILMKPYLKKIKNLENRSTILKGRDFISTFFTVMKNGRIVFFKIRSDLTQKEQLIALRLICLNYLVSLIKKQIDINKITCLINDEGLVKCSRNCNDCIIGKFITNMKVIAAGF